MLPTDIPGQGALIILAGAERIMPERPANTVRVVPARIMPERPANTMRVAPARIIPEWLEITMPERRRIIPQRAAFPTGERRRDINRQRAATIRQRAVLMQQHPLIRPVRVAEGQGHPRMRQRSIESS
jgi:hypothetical protein